MQILINMIEITHNSIIQFCLNEWKQLNIQCSVIYNLHSAPLTQQSNTFSPAKLTQVRKTLDRVETYDGIAEFERSHPRESADEGEASDLEPSPLSKTIDPKLLQTSQEYWRNYQEELKNAEFNLPQLCPSPNTAAKTTIEEILDEIKDEEPEKREELFKQRIADAARKTITLPIECLPPQVIEKHAYAQFQKPRRMLRSQIDFIFQSSLQVEKSDKIEQQMSERMSRRPKPRVDRYTPSKIYQQMMKKQIQKFEQNRVNSVLDIERQKMERAKKQKSQIQEVIKRNHKEAPPVYKTKDDYIVDLMKLDKSVSRIQEGGSLIQGYDALFGKGK